MYQTSFTCASLASEPDEVKKILEVGTGISSLSVSASSIAGSWLRPENRCAKGSRPICSAAASTSSSLPYPSAVHQSPAIPSR